MARARFLDHICLALRASGLWILRHAAKFDPFLSLDCTRVEGVGVQSKFCHLATLLLLRNNGVYKHKALARLLTYPSVLCEAEGPSPLRRSLPRYPFIRQTVWQTAHSFDNNAYHSLCTEFLQRN